MSFLHYEASNQGFIMTSPFTRDNHDNMKCDNKQPALIFTVTNIY